MKKIVCLGCSLILLFVLSGCSRTEKGHTFEIKDGEFMYDGKVMHIYSGEMHYPRVPQEYWRHRFRMIKSMGLNTVATYVFWNYHNPAPGVWDFETGNHNLAEYIRTAQEEGLFVILRPGPYVCAEWEFGGYPWWLQNNEDLVVRTNQPFLDSCRIYINKLAEQVSNLQVTKGGPIIMVQVENEFGSYVAQRKDIPLEEHRKYYNSIKQMLSEAGFDVPFFTSDGSWLFKYGSIDGVLPTANGEDDVANLKKCVDSCHAGKGPYMVAEFYPGWLDHWNERFVRIGMAKICKQTKEYLQHGISFNFYMVHGGTNFGFTSGANYNEEHDIQPDITSYDYDAPISEAGWATPKYLIIRSMINKYVGYPLPSIPEKIPVITIPEISLDRVENIFEWCENIIPVKGENPLSFEELGQGHGFVLYRRHFDHPVRGILQVIGLRDYALVYVNKAKAGELNRYSKNYSLNINIPANGILDILVENMGRINYGAEIPNNRKGIISPVIINNKEITGQWQMYRIPLDKVPDLGKVTDSNKQGLPAFYSGTFNLQETGDVFLDMRDWGKGVVFVNGHNMGRYWKTGPQQTLYLPGCWLKKENNEIVIFELQNDVIQKAIKTCSMPILDKLRTDLNQQDL